MRDTTGKEIIANIYGDSYVSYALKAKENYQVVTNIFDASEVLLLRVERFDNMSIIYEILKDGTIRTIEIYHHDENDELKLFNITIEE